MRKYPPLVLTDHHEFGYYRSFFPPTRRPGLPRGRRTDRSDDIYDIYGPAIAKEFERQGVDYFNQGYGYDFFSPIFTDTVHVVRLPGRAGMTVEVYNERRIYRRVESASRPSCGSRSRRQRTDAAAPSSTGTGPSVEAVEQGREGDLCRTASTSADRHVRVPVPNHAGAALLHPRRRAGRHARDAARLVRLLQRMDVDVHRLTHAARGARLPSPPRDAAARDAAGRHVLDPDGTAAEALDPGRDERGHVRADRPGVRPHRLQPRAAVGRAHRVVRLRRSIRSAKPAPPIPKPAPPSTGARCRRSRSCGSPRPLLLVAGNAVAPVPVGPRMGRDPVPGHRLPRTSATGRSTEPTCFCFPAGSARPCSRIWATRDSRHSSTG